MPSPLASIRRTRPLKHVAIARLVAGLPLAGINAMHLIGTAPMKPILDAARIPMAGVMTIVAPVFGLAAGILLITGAWTRVGVMIACGSMVVALYAHVTANWPDEPPIVLPIAVLLAAAYVLWRGGGAWSIDAKAR